MYIQVNFGRNIGDEPMSSTSWGDFSREVTAAIVDYAYYMSGGSYSAYWANVETHTGRGEWNGVREESRHISLFWDDATPADKRNFAEDLKAGEILRQNLRSISDTYGQDNVALIVGSELI